MLYRIRNNFYAKYLLTIFSIAGGYFALVLLDNFSAHSHQSFCIFNLATGIPCPGCGMGRATLALLNGDIPLSFSYNILCIPFTLAIVFSLGWAALDLFRHEERFLKYVKKDVPVKYKFLLSGIIALNWAINIVRL